MNKELAPIILFVYNRLDHTCQTVEALKRNELASVSTLYIFSDGTKENATDEQRQKVQDVRDYIHSISGFKEVIVEESAINKGLADSIVGGLTQIVNRHGCAIVLEDDIVTSPGFLTYMNDALNMYEDNEQVMHIAGYMYPLKDADKLPQTFFYPAASCWGWATWKRAWDKFCPDAEYLYNAIKERKLQSVLNINTIHGFEKQLTDNISGSLYTWFIKWHASVVLNQGYCLYPNKSLVQNVGFDGSGEHCGECKSLQHPRLADKVDVKRQKIKYNKTAIRLLKHFGEPEKESLVLRIKSYLANRFRNLMVKCMPELLQVRTNSTYFTGNLKDNVIIGRNVSIAPVHRIIDSSIGDYTYVGPNSTIQRTTIGKFCSIGPNLFCGWGVHPIDGISTAPMFYSTKKQNGMTLSSTDKSIEQKRITIGNDVFIGANVTILDGVSIGNGAVIGAGAVVSKDIPPYAVAVGCPIKIMRRRFPEEAIADLQQIEWWNFDENSLKDVEKYEFDIEAFLHKYKQ